ncbi:hypothetical protein DKK66_10145 [Aquitalea sp. USM4]|nr:hypothetical protein DKK66_10145 [Aquitalea sp. USM4]
MWDGTVDFLLKFKSGDYGSLWAQHNEHRIVLAKIIFIADHYFFGGRNVFSVVANYIFFGLSGYVFFLYSRRVRLSEVLAGDVYKMFVFTMLSWLFLWTQSDNFYLAFQSQFVLAQLLPLTAFYFMAKNAKFDRSLDFFAACFFAILAMGSMANGVLAFPLMYFYALLLKMNRRKCVLLLVAAVAFPAIYFFHYHAPEGHGHLLVSLRTQPLQFLLYVLMYLGSPFHYLLGKGVGGNVAALIMGAVLIIFSLLMFIRQLKAESRSEFILALLLFIAYISATAIGTAGGRLIFGINQALESRYTTPAIMAWTAFFLSVASSFVFEKMLSKRMFVAGFVLLNLCMLGVQLKTLKPVNPMLYIREQAALALSLKVNDVDYVHSVYPDADRAMMLANRAAQNGVSIFSKPPFFDLSSKIGYKMPSGSFSMCSGSVDHVYLLAAAPDYIRIDGWVYSPIDKKSPERMTIVNDQGLIAGYAVVGMPRDDVASKFGSPARSSGFGGYIKKSFLTQSMYGIGTTPQCRFVMK